MINKNREKTAFSLIEIMQTIILLGIIASLSISFFKKFDSNEKIYISTEKLLNSAVKEAGNRMCNDYTPACLSPEHVMCNGDAKYCSGEYVTTSDISYCDKLNAFISASGISDISTTYNKEHGWCEYESDKDCHAPISLNTGAYKVCENQSDGSRTVKSSEPYDTIVEFYRTPDGTKCYTAPLCYGKIGYLNTIADCTDATIGKNDNVVSFYYEATTRSEAFLCPNNTPAFNAEHSPQVTELCYQLWSILNHKKQTISGAACDDLCMTCNNDRTMPDCILDGDCTANRDKDKTDTNMILPNGARLYNLNFPKNDPKNIYIKYDRIPQINTITSATIGDGKNTKPVIKGVSISSSGVSPITGYKTTTSSDTSSKSTTEDGTTETKK